MLKYALYKSLVIFINFQSLSLHIEFVCAYHYTTSIKWPQQQLFKMPSTKRIYYVRNDRRQSSEDLERYKLEKSGTKKAISEPSMKLMKVCMFN